MKRRFIFFALFCLTSLSAISQSNKSLGYYENAQSFVNTGRNDLALSELNKALQANPSDERSLFLRAYVYLITNSSDLALQDYTQILKINPSHEGALVNRSLILMQTESYELALSDLNRLTELRPKDPSAWFDLAYCYGLMGENEKAILNFDKSIALDGSNGQSYANRGFCKINLATNSGFTEADPKKVEQACADLFEAQALGDTTVQEMISRYCN
jgi:tetratricopeptide (TPR) repeat protein